MLRASRQHGQGGGSGGWVPANRSRAGGLRPPGYGIALADQASPHRMQRGGSARPGGLAPPVVHKVLSAPGRPLRPADRAFFEPRLGRDLGHVRVHTDARAAEAARAVDARAFTVGRNIVFGAGQWSHAVRTPLLAHELAHVAQQSAPAAAPPAELRLAEAGSAESEAASVARRVMGGERAAPGRRTEAVLHRQAAGGAAAPATTIDASSASVSWIDPASPAGRMPVVGVNDPAPPATITTSFVTGSSGFRFSNYLHASVTSSDGVHVSGVGAFAADAGLYKSPSLMGIPSHAFPVFRNRTPFTAAGVEGIEFEQTVGARTISGGVIGGGVGAVAGAGIGASLGAKGGAAIGVWFGVAGAVPGAAIGAVGGGVVGFLAGAYTANRVTNFPPIWTRLKLRIRADGVKTCTLAGHSDFPSNNFYCNLSQVSAYSGLDAQQRAWEASGWDGGNPWGAGRPSVTP